MFNQVKCKLKFKAQYKLLTLKMKRMKLISQIMNKIKIYLTLMQMH
jgi:hypothetical protein